MNRKDYLQRILSDFIFMDCRLADHPKVHATIFWLGDGRLEFVTNSNDSSASRKHFSFSPEIGPFVERHIRNRAYSIKHDVALLATSQDQFTKSILTVPILEEDKAVGVLIFESQEFAFFTKEHLGHAQILAALVAYVFLQLDPKIRIITPISISLGQAFKKIREKLGLTQAELAFRMGQNRITLSRWEGGGQAPTQGPLYEWCDALNLVNSRKGAIVEVVDITQHLLERLRKEPSKLSLLSPEQHEQFVAGLIERMGYNVKLTGSTYQKDGGIDLIAIPKTPSIGSFLIAGQIKHHNVNQKTGREAVDRLLSWKEGPFRIGLLVTNTGFTRDALWVASQDQNKAFLRLRDLNDLKRWIEDNFWSEEEWREIPKRIELAPGVTIEIPKPVARNFLSIWPLSEFDK